MIGEFLCFFVCLLIVCGISMLVVLGTGGWCFIVVVVVVVVVVFVSCLFFVCCFVACLCVWLFLLWLLLL